MIKWGVGKENKQNIIVKSISMYYFPKRIDICTSKLGADEA